MRGMKTVLVVDDEPSVLFALSEALSDRRRGVRVVTAANGIEAVAVLEAEPVDLVLTDLRMPDMDGFELLTFLRRNHAALPVILMTALGSAETAARLARPRARSSASPSPSTCRTSSARSPRCCPSASRGGSENISLASFLQLLEMERKTCTLSVRSPIRAAARGSSTSAPAGWWGRRQRRAGGPGGGPGGRHLGARDIEIADGCPAVEPEIDVALSFLLMEGMRIKDEARSGARRPTPRGRSTSTPPWPRPGTGVPPRSEELSRLLEESLKRGKGMKGVEAILIVETTGGVDRRTPGRTTGRRCPRPPPASCATAGWARPSRRFSSPPRSTTG